MTAAAATASTRPRRPRRSLAGPIGIVAFLAITWWASSKEFGIDFNFGEIIGGFSRGAGTLAEFWPPELSFFPETLRPMLETFQMAVIASAIGCSLALPIAFLASRVTTPNLATYVADRVVMNVIRSLPDVLFALIFVLVLGIGPLPGILALTIFNIGVVVKLMSETIDGVDRGPMEAAQATGANRVQTTLSSVLPQVLPNYVAYSLYVFELNIRASAVLGLVGAGGIGRVLEAQRKFFQYDRVMVVLLELFVLVVIIEAISIRLRRRLV
jgi:phosphonate transport system permease protein